jgi:hypothetical protein
VPFTLLLGSHSLGKFIPSTALLIHVHTAPKIRSLSVLPCAPFKSYPADAKKKTHPQALPLSCQLIKRHICPKWNLFAGVA